MIRWDFRRTRAMPRDGEHRHSPRSRVVPGHQIMCGRICSSWSPPPATKAQPAANTISEDRCARRLLYLTLRPEKLCVTPLKWAIVPGPIEPQPIILQVTPRAVFRFPFNIE